MRFTWNIKRRTLRDLSSFAFPDASIGNGFIHSLNCFYIVELRLIEYQHCQDTSSRDVDSLKNFVLEEADKAATNAQAQQLDSDREL
ncbi:hypothetical protein Ahy_A05g023906 [Arachis hypogaea]|uniref:Uncharacterized protein n=1 Tax=Arachis hypogaea TaxID=3818 RepID=A0A445D4T7_ARAHY|nr:hypothetical protein Ahy_A05g023906 [Arachis hypogaea]